jgi:hypothetical protein
MGFNNDVQGDRSFAGNLNNTVTGNGCFERGIIYIMAM